MKSRFSMVVRIAGLCGLLMGASKGGCKEGVDPSLLKNSEISHRKTGEVDGIVLESSTRSPVSGASVQLAANTSTTDANGYFHLAKVTAGQHTLLVYAEGFEPLSVELEIQPGANTLGEVALVRHGPTCDPGWDDCNELSADGCEVDLSTDHGHCGDCATKCAMHELCEGGNCVALSCTDGRADCNLDYRDGCEAILASNRDHCGECGRACATGQACFGSKCMDVLANNQSRPEPFATDNGTLYWMNEEQSLGGTSYSIKRASDTGTPVTIATDIYTPRGVVADADFVYWLEQPSSTLFLRRVSKSGGAREDLYAMEDAPYMSFFGLGERQIYTFEPDKRILSMYDKDGSNEAVQFVLPEASGIDRYSHYLGEENESLLFVGSGKQEGDFTTDFDGALISVAKSDGSYTKLQVLIDLKHVYSDGVAKHKDWLYVCYGKDIARKPLKARSLNPSLPNQMLRELQGGSRLGWFTENTQHIFWGEIISGSDMWKVMTMKKGKHDSIFPALMAPKSTYEAFYFVVDDSYIYFTLYDTRNPSSGKVLRIRLADLD